MTGAREDFVRYPGAPDMSTDAVGSSSGDLPDDECLDMLGPSWASMSQADRDQYGPPMGAGADGAESDQVTVSTVRILHPVGALPSQRTQHGVVPVHLTTFPPESLPISYVTTA